MKKKYILIFIAFGINILLGIYSIVSGTLRDNIRYKEENTKTYNDIVSFIEKSNASYQVLSGRAGGTFTFSIALGQNEISKLSKFLENKGFSSAHQSNIAYCNKLRGIRIVPVDKTQVILEYERKLLECIQTEP